MNNSTTRILSFSQSEKQIDKMALVGYSDSEESEMEDVTPSVPVKSNTNKRVNRSEGGKIRIDLPAVQAETASIEPASKRQRTAGAFTGFNSLLPAPKRTAQTSIKPGFKLKTSSEAAFSRLPAPDVVDGHDDQYGVSSQNAPEIEHDEAPASTEPKLVGKATKFLPLSVANANKKKKKSATKAVPASPSKPDTKQPQLGISTEISTSKPETTKPKQSLFSMEMETDDQPPESHHTYEPEFLPTGSSDHISSTTADVTANQSFLQPAPQGDLSDLGLSEADRRRLFGRHAKSGDIKFTNFNMDAEYRANQDIAANGDLTEHRAVRAIAPGKHSLQQLVNNVRGQSDALEDKWAEGKRNRGEAGSKYGWS